MLQHNPIFRDVLELNLTANHFGARNERPYSHVSLIESVFRQDSQEEYFWQDLKSLSA